MNLKFHLNTFPVVLILISAYTLLWLACCLVTVSGNTGIGVGAPNQFVSQWTHEIKLDGGMRVRWNSNDASYLTMEMFSPINGYVGIGFSPSGGMRGADIVIGWVSPEGIPYVKDYHAYDNEHPIEDRQQDYNIIGGSQGPEGTTIAFMRRWDTCDDPFDMRLGEDTVRLIWAYGSNPEFLPALKFPYHGPTSRGVKSVHLRNPLMTGRFPDSLGVSENEIRNWDIRVNNFQVDPNRHTTYICKLVKFEARQGPKHILGFRPLLDEGSRPYIHHITLYHCFVHPNEGTATEVLDRFVNQPEEDCLVANSIYHNFCMAFAFTWGAGSEGEMFPDHIGIPFGDYTEEPFYFKFEIHYDNPSGRSFRDSSGLRIFYSDKLRPNAAGTMFIGHRVTPFQLIPQRQQAFTSTGFCSRECTQNGLGTDGVKAISVLLHGHLAAKKIKLRHIRNGIELPPIAVDDSFDFNYQQFRTLKNETKIMPGDELLVECTYDTTKRDGFTYGGAGSREEMCQAIMLFYPKSKLADCRSQPEVNSFFEALKIQNVSGDLLRVLHMPLSSDEEMLPDDMFFLQKMAVKHNNEYVENPFKMLQIMSPQLPNPNAAEFLRHNVNWNDSKEVRKLQEAWRDGRHYVFCTSAGMEKIPNYSHIAKIQKFKPYIYDQGGCRYPTRGGGGRYPDNGALSFNFSVGNMALIVLSSIGLGLGR